MGQSLGRAPARAAIVSADINDGIIDTLKLADSAVTAVKVAPDVATQAELDAKDIPGITSTGSAATDVVTIAGNLVADGSYYKVPTVTTTQRNAISATTRMLVYNSTLGMLQQYGANGWQSIDSPPVFTSVTPTTVDETEETLVITGTNFSDPLTSVKLQGNDNTLYTPASITRNSSTQITITSPATALPISNEPYKIVITNSSGLAVTGGTIDAGGVPTFTAHINSFGTDQTANGKDSSTSPPLAASIHNAETGTHHTFAAVDPDGKAVTYTLTGSVWTGRNLALSSAGALTGNPTDVGSTTAYTETVRATDASANYTDQQFQVKIGPGTVRAGDGTDGALTQGSGLKQDCNTYYIITGNVSAAATPTIPLNTVSGLAVGDKVLIWQTQNATTTADIGKMLYATITAVNSPNVTIAETLSWSILSGTSAGTHYNAASAKNAQLIRIPQYTAVTVNSGGVLAPPIWDGQKGGLLIMEVQGACTVNSGGYITASAMGFRGGHGGAGGVHPSDSYEGRDGEFGGGGGVSYSTSTKTTDGHFNPGNGNFPYGTNVGRQNIGSEKTNNSGEIYGWGVGGPGDNPSDAGGGGAGGGSSSSTRHFTNLSANKMTLGCGGGGGGGGSIGNHNVVSRGGAGGGNGAGIIIVRANSVVNNGEIVAKLGYGGGGVGGKDAPTVSTAWYPEGRGSQIAFAYGGQTLGNGNGESNQYSADGNTSADTRGGGHAGNSSNGGSGTGKGGGFTVGTAGPNDHGGRGGFSGVSLGGNGGGGYPSGGDGGPGGGAGGNGGGGSGGMGDIGGGGGGGQGGSGGVIWLEAGTVTTAANKIWAPRGMGGGGGGAFSGGADQGSMGGSSQWAQALQGYGYSNRQLASGSWSDGSNANNTYYNNGPSCTFANGGGGYPGTGGGGGAGGYFGEEGEIKILTTSGSYSGSLSTSTVDNAQAQTGGNITTGSALSSGIFGTNGQSGF